MTGKKAAEALTPEAEKASTKSFATAHWRSRTLSEAPIVGRVGDGEAAAATAMPQLEMQRGGITSAIIWRRNQFGGGVAGQPPHVICHH